MDKKFHTGGIVGLKPMEVPAILRTDQVISREIYERLRVPTHMLESTGKTSRAEIEARIQVSNRLHRSADIRFGPSVFVSNIGRYRRPRTGDSQQMLEDIDRVEKTFATKINEAEDEIVRIILKRKDQIFKRFVDALAH